MFLKIALLLFLIPSICQADIVTGLVSWYKLNDASGSTAIDSGSGAKNGTFNSAPSWQTNCIRTGCYNNAANNYINLGNLSSLVSGSWTINVWFYWNSAQSAERQLYSAFTSPNELGLSIIPGSPNHFRSFCSASGSSNNLYDSTTAVNVGQWYMYTIVFDNSAKTRQRYVNGVVDGASVGTTTTLTFPSVTSYIGNNVDQGSTRPIDAEIDDFRIYNRALSAQDVLDLYNSPIIIRNATLNNVTMSN